MAAATKAALLEKQEKERLTKISNQPIALKLEGESVHRYIRRIDCTLAKVCLSLLLLLFLVSLPGISGCAGFRWFRGVLFSWAGSI